VLIADGYTIRDGVATVPASPGCGLSLNLEKLAAGVKVDFDLKA
jgi:hypothetical protein